MFQIVTLSRFRCKLIIQATQISAESSDVEDASTNGNGKDDTCNETHLAIVELVQKFKFIGNFTVLTTKVNGTIQYPIIGCRKIPDSPFNTIVV